MKNIELNLNVKTYSKNEPATGSLAWTVGKLGKLQLAFDVLADGCLCIRDARVGGAVIVREKREVPPYQVDEVCELYETLSSYTEDGERTYSDCNVCYRIAGCYAEEAYNANIESYNMHIFGKCLTRYSKELVGRFRDECEKLLVKELLDRSNSEAEEIRNIEIAVEIKK